MTILYNPVLGASLEQIHIFALAHILRRPIIVYGIKFVKSFRGENIGLARFQGEGIVRVSTRVSLAYICVIHGEANQCCQPCIHVNPETKLL